MNTIDSFNITGSTSSLKTDSITGFGLSWVPLSANGGCGIRTIIASEFLTKKKKYIT